MIPLAALSCIVAIYESEEYLVSLAYVTCTVGSTFVEMQTVIYIKCLFINVEYFCYLLKSQVNIAYTLVYTILIAFLMEGISCF